MAGNPQMFEKALTTKEIKFINEITETPLTPDQCNNIKLSLIQEMYNYLFVWMVYKINTKIRSDTSASNSEV